MRHPVFARRGRLAAYGLFTLTLGALIAGVVVYGGRAPVDWALRFALPLAVVFGFQSLGNWYLVRALPSESTPPLRLAASWATAALVSVGAWVVAGVAWASFLLGDAPLAAKERAQVLQSSALLLAACGLLGFAVAALAFYLLAAFERSREAERRALEATVLAREAELRALKAQLDPHFLFNSLNSVAALIGTDAAAARRMCFLMSGFFRKSLALGRKEAIPLAEEIYLAETFLAIEQVRFGDRLRTHFEVDEDAMTLAVPPLVLQPLVENAVHHGVAHLVEGGEVRVAVRREGGRDSMRDGGRLLLEVSNPCDPDRPASRGAGVGLANVRARLVALHAERASVEVDAAPERHTVRLRLPLAPAAV
jgi:two-component system sensor histidine kinase AlgZ